MFRASGRRAASGCAHPWAVVCAGHVPALLLLTPTVGSRLFRSDSRDFLGVFSYLWPMILPQLFSVPVSLWFVAGGEVCPGARTAAKGLRSQNDSGLELSRLKIGEEWGFLVAKTVLRPHGVPEGVTCAT